MSLKMGKVARRMLVARLDGTIHGLRLEWEQNRLRNIYDAGRASVDGDVCPYPRHTQEWRRWYDGKDASHWMRVRRSEYGIGYMQGRGAA